MRTWRPLAAGAAICSITTLMASCASHEPEARGTDERVAATTQSLVTNCKYLDQSQYAPLPVDVDFDREIVVRDLSVVEDPCRTTWNPSGGCDPATVGVWTFGHLMIQMAGTTPPAQFAAEWIHTFEVNQLVNGFPVPKRTNVRAALIDPWLVASGCKAGDKIVDKGSCALDLKKAPFRLLAIVNRVDLAGPAYGVDNPGEARFVFGMLNLGNGKGGKLGDGKPAADPSPAPLLAAATPEELDLVGVDEPNEQLQGSALKGTVILEYRIPQSQKQVEWTQRWHDLSSIPLGVPEFNAKLQQITDIFSLQGADSSRPNLGSSIGQVRTNEISLGNGDWELREFSLQDVGLGVNASALRNTTTAQTPDDSQNGATPLDAWMIANEPDIINVDHVVPTGFLGGVSHESGAVFGTSAVPALDPHARHHFAVQMCNGCHNDEIQDTGFTHIGTRGLGSVAPLSPFLGQSPAPDPSFNGLPATIHIVPDAMSPSDLREYNEPWRRVCEITRILNNDPDPYTRGNGGVH
jgi:hypothetical protein